MGKDKTALFYFLFELVIRVYFDDMLRTEIARLPINIILNFFEQIFDILFDIIATTGFFFQRIATHNLYGIVFEIASSNNQTHRNAFQFVIGKLKSRPLIVGIIIFYRDTHTA